MFDLIKQIKILESNSALKKKIITNGYKDFKKNYSEDLIIKKFFNFFNKIID